MIFSSYIGLSLHDNAQEGKIICCGLTRCTPPKIRRYRLKEYNCNCKRLAYRHTTGWMVWGSNSTEGKRFSVFHTHPDGSWGSPSIYNWYCLYPGSSVGLALTNYSKFSPGFNIGKGKPLLPLCASNRML